MRFLLDQNLSAEVAEPLRAAGHVTVARDVFLAGRCFAQYRGRSLLTRDRPRHLDLLPGLKVISPG